MNILNETELRNVIRHMTPAGDRPNYYTADYPYWAAKEFIYKDYWGYERFASISVYGKHTKTVRLSRNDGYKFVYKIIAKVKTKNRLSAAYAEIAEIIEKTKADDLNN